MNSHQVGYFKRCEHSGSDNLGAIEAANHVLKCTETASARADCNFDGGNANTNSIEVEFNKNTYFVPPTCRFYRGDVIEITQKLKTNLDVYDVIVLDPPWWNKHVRRKNARATYQG